MLKILSTISDVRRSERGATALIFAIMGMLLFGLAALTVDLGKAFVSKRDTQSQADFSALSAGAALPGKKLTSDPAVIQAVAYLNANKPNKAMPDVTAAQLTDGLATDPNPAFTDAAEMNGEVYFLDGGSQVRVIAPRQTVTFGLAGAFGVSNTSLNATATAGVFSPGTAVMPAFAVSGCDYGPQVLTDPANGHVTPAVPTLANDTDSNIASLDAPSATVTNPDPGMIDASPATPITITLKGQKLDEVTQVGFFKEGVGTTPPSSPLIIPNSEITHSGNQELSFALPSAAAPTITATEALYWLRVWAPEANNSTTYKWSAVKNPSGSLNTLPFRVGRPYLQCVGASNEGNFGTLILAREDTGKASSTGWLPVNIAAGLQPPLSLNKYLGPVDATGLCNPAPLTTNTSFKSGPTIYTETAQTAQLTDLLPQTNCVDTDPGLPANSATAGLITWTGSVTGMSGSSVTTGRLVKPASAGCPSSRTVTINHTSYSINDDTLTCFFLDNTATVADVSAASYVYNGGSPVISSEIYSSPRFYWVPVLKVKPSGGGSNHYAIVDFRPAFLTDQPTTATKAVPQVGAQNGVEVTGNDVTQIRVVFLNWTAIEDPVGGPVIPWLGTGPRIIRLID